MNKLKGIREQKKLSQRRLSELSGVKLTTVEKLDGGFNNVNKAQAETLYKLARALGVGIEDLINIDEIELIS